MPPKPRNPACHRGRSTPQGKVTKTTKSTQRSRPSKTPVEKSARSTTLTPDSVADMLLASTSLPSGVTPEMLSDMMGRFESTVDESARLVDEVLEGAVNSFGAKYEDFDGGWCDFRRIASVLPDVLIPGLEKKDFNLEPIAVEIFLRLLCARGNAIPDDDAVPDQYCVIGTLATHHIVNAGTTIPDVLPILPKLEGGGLLDKEALIFPCDLDEQGWMLVVVFPKGRTIQFYDSRPDTEGDKQCHKVLLAIMQWVAMLEEDRFDAKEWSIWNGQSDTHVKKEDSGVFLCWNALAALRRVNPKTVISRTGVYNARRVIAAAIILGNTKPLFGW